VARDIQTYEDLRGAVLQAQARPEGLAAVAYHGLLGGLKVIGSMAVPAPASTGLPVPTAPVAPSPTDPALVRLLANMVLLYQQEVSHVV
jgi:hypothetical protein